MYVVYQHEMVFYCDAMISFQKCTCIVRVLVWTAMRYVFWRVSHSLAFDVCVLLCVSMCVRNDGWCDGYKRHLEQYFFVVWTFVFSTAIERFMEFIHLRIPVLKLNYAIRFHRHTWREKGSSFLEKDVVFPPPYYHHTLSFDFNWRLQHSVLMEIEKKIAFYVELV